MNALQSYANHFAQTGWTISSMSDQQFVATRRKGISPIVGLFGVLGLLFYLIPGLLLLLIGYVARGTETKIITATEAVSWQEEKEQRDRESQAKQEEKAKQVQVNQEARRVARENRIAELSESPLRYWYMMTENQKVVLFLAIIIIALYFIAN